MAPTCRPRTRSRHDRALATRRRRQDRLHHRRRSRDRSGDRGAPLRRGRQCRARRARAGQARGARRAARPARRVVRSRRRRLRRAARDAVDGTIARFGAIDVAIANAGIQFMGRMATVPREQFERTIEVNLLGTWRTDRAVLDEIVRNRGYLLNISSLAAASHAPLMGAYAASKAGVEAMTDCLRAELAPSGARVGCAYFGFIDTDLVRASYAHASTQAMMARPARLHRPAGAAGRRRRRDRAGHRAALGAALGAALRRRRADLARHRAAARRAADAAQPPPPRRARARRSGRRRADSTSATRCSASRRRRAPTARTIYASAPRGVPDRDLQRR